MSCIDNVGRSPLHPSTLPAAETLSTKEMKNQLRGLDAFAIELIAIHVITKILERLGPNRKFETEQTSDSDGDTPEAFFRNLKILAAMTKVSDEEQKPFLSEAQTSEFIYCASPLFKQELQEMFSTPALFLDEGIHWQVSDYWPERILAKVLKQMGLQVKITGVPTKYWIVCKLDTELTKQKSELVFRLIEISDREEMANTTFTIRDLYTNEFKNWELGLVGASDLRQQSNAKAAQLE